MSILSRFTRSKAAKETSGDIPSIAANCPHWELAPRWDSVADIGYTEKVTSYACTTCGKTLTPEEARDRSISS